MLHILKCQKCGSYTLKQNCKCGGIAIPIKPPKFSLEDKYGIYRRKAKEDYFKKKGLI